MKTKQIHLTGVEVGTDFYYCYLQDNGRLIFKPGNTDPADFEQSDLVKKWWKLFPNNLIDLYLFLTSALMNGAHRADVDKIIKDCRITDEETKLYCKGVNILYDETPGGFRAIYVLRSPQFPTKIFEGTAANLFDAVVNMTRKLIDYFGNPY